jgi:hypothetical protein
MKNSLFTFLLIILFININFGQSSSKNKESEGITNKLWYGINIGNIGISNNQFNTNLSLMGGYKITDRINIGAIIHGYYDYYWQRGNDSNQSIFDFGFGGLANVKVFRNYFAQIEVDQMYRTKYDWQTGSQKQLPYLFTYIGGGYQYNPSQDWSFAITLLYNVNPDSNSEFFPLDYRVAFVHNF